jgi:hypothetical protein
MKRLATILFTCSALASAALKMRESAPPGSSFRKYFWGARQAYEQRDFKSAEKLFRTYRRLGSPSDKMLTQAGCDTTWEVALFKDALKDARSCMAARSKSASWTDAEHAKFAILVALRQGEVDSLIPFVDCAPADLVTQATTCGSHVYRKAEDLKRLAAALKKTPAVLDWPEWRHMPVPPKDTQNIPWVLYSNSEQWKPCGLPRSPIISLRQDPSGQVRIAAFACTCLEPTP